MISLEKLQFGNGAGCVKTIEDLEKACKGPATRIVVGSITKESRSGNVGETYYFEKSKKWSMNSLGLPNVGIQKYREWLPHMAQKAGESGKELWASVAGFSPEEYVELTLACLTKRVDGIEINLSCPNVWGEGGRKAIPALDWNLTYEIIARIRGRVDHSSWDSIRPRLSLKLSPTDDRELIERLAIVIGETGLGWVTVGNTIPDQERFREEDGKFALSFRSSDDDPVLKHKGGLAGSAVKNVNVAMVRALRQRLPERVQITGAGGIFDAADALEYLEAGANAFQCTTGCFEYGNKVFEPILRGLADVLPEAA